MTGKNKIDLDRYRLIAGTLTESDSVESMASDLIQLLVSIFEIKGATLFILNAESEEFEILATEGLSKDYVSKGPILVDKSIHKKANRESIVISDTENTTLLQYPEKAKDEGIRSIISIPVVIRGKIIGSLRLYDSEVWDVSSEEVAYLKVLVQNIGMALMYYRLATAVNLIRETVEDIHPIWL